MGFFDLTEEDVKKSNTFSNVKFKDGDHATLQIAKIIKKEIKGDMKTIIECIVLDGEHSGGKHSIFYGSSDGAKGALVIFLSTFMKASEISNSNPNDLINKKFEADFVGDYGNARNCVEVSDVPSQVATPTPAAMPTADGGVEVTADMSDLSKSIFG